MKRIGSTLKGGKYTLETTIAKGGFGITYIAVSSHDGKKVCIKEFYAEKLCGLDPQTGEVKPLTNSTATLFFRFKEKFIKEARILMQLNNSHIVKVYDVFEENGTAYYVMEYIEGQPLSKLIPKMGMDATMALSLIDQVLTATQYIHDNHICHLDIKPSNIMVRKNGDVVLIDFGGCKRFDNTSNGTSTAPITQSEGFAPIELYKENASKEFSPATDMYEIGATLYNMITGEIPPAASDIIDEGNPIEKRSDINPNIKKAIISSMAGRVKDRIQSATEFKKILLSRNIGIGPQSGFPTSDSDEIDSTLIEDYPQRSPNDNGITTIESNTNTPPSLSQQNINIAEINPYYRPANGKVGRRRTIFFIILSVMIVIGWLFALYKINRNNPTERANHQPAETTTILDTIEMVQKSLTRFESPNTVRHHESILGARLDSAVLNNKTLRLYTTIDQTHKNVFTEMSKLSKSDLKDIELNLIRTDPELLNICKLLYPNGISYQVVYRYDGKKNNIEIDLTPDELNSLKDYAGNSYTRTTIEEGASFTKKFITKNNSNDLIRLSSCYVKDNELIYEYSCFNDVIFNDYKNELNQHKKNMKERLTTNPTEIQLVEACTQAGLNIKQIILRQYSDKKPIELLYCTILNQFI